MACIDHLLLSAHMTNSNRCMWYRLANVHNHLHFNYPIKLEHHGSWWEINLLGMSIEILNIQRCNINRELLDGTLLFEEELKRIRIETNNTNTISGFNKG